MIRTTFALFAMAAAIAVTACTSSTGDESGSNAGALKTKKDGSPTGDGKTCSWEGVDSSVSYDVATGKTTTTPTQYKLGDSFPALDGCNTCSCTANGIFCTLAMCTPPAGTCEYQGHTWHAGDAIPSLDGCNSFSCTDGGLINTDMACQYTCPAETTIDCMPIVPEERLALCHGAYHQWIGANCPGVVFAL